MANDADFGGSGRARRGNRANSGAGANGAGIGGHLPPHDLEAEKAVLSEFIFYYKAIN